MKRKLAVPLAVTGVKPRAVKTRILKETEDVEDIRVLAALAENRLRLERLEKDIERGQDFFEAEDIEGELDYIKTTIQFGLFEAEGELEDVPAAEEMFEEAVA